MESKIEYKYDKQFGTHFGAHTETQAQQKKNKNGPHFGDPLPPHLRDPNNAPPKSKREGWKKGLDWNYTLQKKGRDKAL